ncbi:cytochrome c peroxidase [uncultured Maritimibacter sp.]|jgi:cytochrome c peroxidase|uniref:cytochrome-c peroxidase n=1 Tax=uncultured Maritimibacter sp. TaxID=991866 RepID=UPI000A830CC9|nr:cytochrome c peroxidase [uncultured Maritimibacter sp.]
MTRFWIGFLLLPVAANAAEDVPFRPDLGPEPVFVTTDMARVELGQKLFYDPILSGNRNIACSTCHHPRLGTGDGVSLSIGEGGTMMGPERHMGAENRPEQRIPRNAPGLWNLGAEEFTVMFHDGRLEADPDEPNGIRTPLGAEMVAGFDSVLSAQSMFPVLSGDEMAGHYSENEVSEAVRLGFLASEGGAWDRLAARVAAVPEYAAAFEAVAPGQPITFPEISNVVADFIRFEWRATDSLFDQMLRGEATLPPEAQRGMELFYGEAGCASCHSGWFQTDHDFHAIGMPQFGPGKAARFENHHRDEGRMRVTGDPADAYAFRTPSLRNVTLTAPYGHNGAYPTLEGVVRQHLDPVGALKAYVLETAALPAFDKADDTWVIANPAEVDLIAAASDLTPNPLPDEDVAALVAFLETLTDKAERLGVPDSVPSGLPVDR